MDMMIHLVDVRLVVELQLKKILGNEGMYSDMQNNDVDLPIVEGDLTGPTVKWEYCKENVIQIHTSSSKYHIILFKVPHHPL